jgi:hypothetical protein
MALIALAVLVALAGALFELVAAALIVMGIHTPGNGVPFTQGLVDIGVAASLLVPLVVLIYALTSGASRRATVVVMPLHRMR